MSLFNNNLEFDGAGTSGDEADEVDDDNVKPEQQELSSPSVSSFEPTQESQDELEQEPPRKRFRGAKRYFKQKFRDELDFATSQDNLENDNLSIHLYNVHAWKRRVKQKNQSNSQLKSEKHNSSSTPSHPQQEWQPNWKWSSWPLPPSRVPRVGDSFMHDQDPVDCEGLIKPKRKTREKPSQALEDCLLQEALKQSREKFYSKFPPQQFGFDEHSRLKRRTLFSLSESPTPEDGNSDRSDREGSEEEDQADRDDEDDEDNDRDDGPDHNSGNDGNGRSTTPVEWSEQPPEQKPFGNAPATIMTDEDDAYNILKPAVRHILTKLDRLLSTAHKSNFHTFHPAWSVPLDVDSALDVSTSSQSNFSKEKIEFINHAKSPWLTIGKSHRQRDWSEVLGAAALANWDPQVLTRVRSRCEQLFGESMGLRTLHEESLAEGHLDSIYGSIFQPPSISQEHETEAASNPSGLDYENKLPIIPPPIDVLTTLNCPFDCKWENRGPSYKHLRAHMKRKHGVIFRNRRQKLPPYLTYLDCPFQRCEYHNEPFAQFGHLKVHLHKVHGIDYHSGKSENEATRRADLDAIDKTFELADDIEGGVHVDGFLQPIKVRTSWLSKDFI